MRALSVRRVVGAGTRRGQTRPRHTGLSCSESGRRHATFQRSAFATLPRWLLSHNAASRSFRARRNCRTEDGIDHGRPTNATAMPVIYQRRSLCFPSKRNFIPRQAAVEPPRKIRDAGGQFLPLGFQELWRPALHLRRFAPITNATNEGKRFEFIRGLVYEHSRINLGPTSANCVRPPREAPARHQPADGRRILSPPADRTGRRELAHLIDAISTNHTFFSRDRALRFPERTVVPEMKAVPGPSAGPFNVWSAACSSARNLFGRDVARRVHGENLAVAIECTTSRTASSQGPRGNLPEDTVGKLSPERIRTYSSAALVLMRATTA